MDASKLAQTMLQWEAMKEALDELEATIQAAVLELGKTQTVGRVRATYSSGRKAYDYQAAVGRSGLDVDDYIYKPIEADWKKTAEAACLKDIPFTQSEPSVSLKLLP